MVKCPWCRQEIPIEEYLRHYDKCYKGMPPEEEFKTKKISPKLKIVFTEHSITVYPAAETTS